MLVGLGYYRKSKRVAFTLAFGDAKFRFPDRFLPPEQT
jgi:hypothetical protein